jgi:F-type H+-transporting ATPase subunit gamma
MSSIRNTKNRIKSVQSTSKLTKAMKLIASIRLQRYNKKIAQLKKYTVQLEGSITSFLSVLPDSDLPKNLKGNPEGKILLVIMSPSRGFCGGLHRLAVSDCLKQFREINVDITDSNQVEMVLVNKPAKRGITKVGGKVIATFVGPYKEVDTYTLLPISELTNNLWQSGKYKSIYISFAESNLAFKTNIKIQQILPLSNHSINQDSTKSSFSGNVEGDIDSLVNEVLPLFIHSEIQQSILSTKLAEEGSRMVAMSQATDNAKELERKLKLVYFRQRQAKITQEISEIIGGSL